MERSLARLASPLRRHRSDTLEVLGDPSMPVTRHETEIVLTMKPQDLRRNDRIELRRSRRGAIGSPEWVSIESVASLPDGPTKVHYVDEEFGKEKLMGIHYERDVTLRVSRPTIPASWSRWQRAKYRVRKFLAVASY